MRCTLALWLARTILSDCRSFRIVNAGSSQRAAGETVQQLDWFKAAEVFAELSADIISNEAPPQTDEAC
jgi:hypothetical protein